MTDLHKDAGSDVRIWSSVGQVSLGIVLAEENFLIQDNTSFLGAVNIQWMNNMGVQRPSSLNPHQQNSKSHTSSVAPDEVSCGLRWDCIAAEILPLPVLLSSKGVDPKKNP